jgi:hypothetical protein
MEDTGMSNKETKQADPLVEMITDLHERMSTLGVIAGSTDGQLQSLEKQVVSIRGMLMALADISGYELEVVEVEGMAAKWSRKSGLVMP